jgi:hypothetical protein
MSASTLREMEVYGSSMKTPKNNFSIVQTSKFVNEMTKYDLTK